MNHTSQCECPHYTPPPWIWADPVTHISNNKRQQKWLSGPDHKKSCSFNLEFLGCFLWGHSLAHSPWDFNAMWKSKPAKQEATQRERNKPYKVSAALASPLRHQTCEQSSQYLCPSQSGLQMTPSPAVTSTNSQEPLSWARSAHKTAWNNNNYCFKQPSFRVICCIAIDHWNT